MNLTQDEDESTGLDFTEIELVDDQIEESAEEEKIVLLAGPPEPDEKTKQITPRKGALTVQMAMSLFSACPRCCYFLAGYQVAHGRPNLKTAVQQSKAGWLTLSWNRHTSELIHKSYGNQIDTGCYHFEGCCPECRRHFIYRAAQEHKLDSLRIELRPHAR